MDEPIYSYVRGRGWVCAENIYLDADGTAWTILRQIPEVGDAYICTRSPATFEKSLNSLKNYTTAELSVPYTEEDHKYYFVDWPSENRTFFVLRRV